MNKLIRVNANLVKTVAILEPENVQQRDAIVNVTVFSLVFSERMDVRGKDIASYLV